MEKRYIPIVKWNKYHDWPSVNGLRGIMRDSASNGSNKVFKRVGRKIVVDENQFFEWMETQTNVR
jgi:hypothetical protein